MKPNRIKWLILVGLFFFNIPTLFSQKPFIPDLNGWKPSIAGENNWAKLETESMSEGPQLNDENPNCQTYVYRTKLQAGPGEKIQLEGATTFFDNTVLAATSILGVNQLYTSNLVHLNADGSIKKQVNFSVGGNQTRIMAMVTDGEGNIYVSGTLPGPAPKVFISKLKRDLSVVETRLWNTLGDVSKVHVYTRPDHDISIAVETPLNHIVYQLTPQLAILWTSVLPRSAENRIQGLWFSYKDKVLIGRTKKNGNNNEAYEVIALNHITGEVMNSWGLPNQVSAESIQQFNGFSNTMCLTGISQKSNGVWQAWQKTLNGMPQTFNDRYYEFDEPLNNATTVRTSQGLDALAVCNGQTGKLYFLFQNMHNNGGPTRSREISIPVQSRIKSFLRTTDGGYQYILDKNGGNEILLIKADSAGLLMPCETKAISVKYERKDGTMHQEIKTTGSLGNTQEALSTLQTSASNLTLQFECQNRFCPPKPEQDTCTPGFLKAMKSNFFGSSVYDGIIKNDNIYTAGAIFDNFSEVDYKRTGIVGKYDLAGEYQKSFSVFADRQSVRPFLWPGNGDTLLMHAPVRRNDSLFMIFTALNTNFDILWTTTILSYYRINNYNSAPVVSDMVIDEEGNVYIIVTQSNLSITERNFGVIKLNRQGQMIWNKVYSPTNRFIGTVTAAVGKKGLLLMVECSMPSSFTMLLSKETGDRLALHTFDNNDVGGSVIGEPAYQLNYHNGKFYYLGAGYRSLKSYLLAAVLDDYGRTEKMLDLGPVYSRITANLWNGVTDIMTSIFDETSMEYKVLKIQLDENLDTTHAMLINPLDGYFHTVSMMHSSIGSPFVLGFRIYNNDPMSNDNFLAKFTQEGKLGNCYSEPHILNIKELTSTEMNITVELSGFLFNSFTAMPIDLQPFQYGITESELFCKSEETCKALNISGPKQICDPSAIQSFIAKRNSGCSLMPQWQVDSALMEVIQRKGDTLKVRFKVAGNHTIKAKLLTGCNIYEDSMEVFVNTAISKIDLGKDTVICPADSIRLNAGAGFSSYTWSNGLSDSAIWVKSQGMYWISVKNDCGVALRDSMLVNVAQVPALSAGNDTTVCAGNSFSRQATPGFASYRWTSNSLSNNPVETPLLNTVVREHQLWNLTAATTLGCVARDSFSLFVKTARPYSLGNDTSLCAKDSVQFSAPPDYVSYQWNTGAKNNNVFAKEAGIFILAALDSNNCTFSDSVSILQLFPLPQPALANDQSICTGTNLLISPGKFERYEWNNGSSSDVLNVSQPGTYAVKVWDNNGCFSSDTMEVLSLWPLPSDYLNATDSICQFEKLQISTTKNFNKYLWNTGSNQRNIEIDKPGNYFVTVTDQNGCVGVDSLLVIQKNCIEGVFIPNAFTPNNDGLNDVFKPLVYGNVIRLAFSVYNRYGEQVFQSAVPNTGWNGLWKGQLQPTGTYVWVCTYHLVGSEPTMQKGTVVLVR